MNIGIIGSRDFNNYGIVCKTMEKYIPKDIKIISGGARGADTLGEKYAHANNLAFTSYLADWERHGKRAGFIRNKDIVKNSDIVIAFWDGISKGTAHSIELCKKSKTQYMIVNFEGLITMDTRPENLEDW